MRYNTLLDSLQNLINYRPSQKELGKVLGLAQTSISGRANRNSNFTDEEVQKIEAHYNVILLEGGIRSLDIFPLNFGIMTIPFWEDLPEDLKVSDISVIVPTDLIKNYWYLNPDNLRVVPMVGDKMTNYWYRINENDILIIDTSHNFIRGNGVYFATSRDNSRFWIREMQALINDDIQIKGFAPSGETTKVFTQEQLADVDFKIIGKVIKNVSFRL